MRFNPERGTLDSIETDPVFTAWLAGSPLAGYVPYTGATGDVNLGARNFVTTGTLGAGAITGTSLGILESGASPQYYTYFQGGDQAADVTYTLPTAKGAAGTYLKDVLGNGVLSWAAGSAAGVALSDNNLWTGTNEFQHATGVSLGKDAATNVAGVLKFWSAGANAYYSTFTAGTQSANETYTLPTAMAAANSLPLISSTAGVMSWSANFGANNITTTGTTQTKFLTVTGNPGVGGGSVRIMMWDAVDGVQNFITWHKDGTYDNSLFIGDGAGAYMTDTSPWTQKNNMGIGYLALNRVGTGAADDTAINNLAIGAASARLLTTGYSNTLIGNLSGTAATTAYNNTGIGNWIFQALTTGYQNTAIGRSALNDLTTGHDNTAIGNNSMEFCTGNYNTAIGAGSGAVTTGSENTIIGANIASALSSGQYNTIIGVNAADRNNGDRNVFIGWNAGNNVGITAVSDKLYIDANSNLVPLIYGDFANSFANVKNKFGIGIGTVAPKSNFQIVNNLATGFLNTFAEYQILLNDSGTATSSDGIGVKTNTVVFNSGGGAYSFDKNGASTQMTISTAGYLGLGTVSPTSPMHVIASTAAGVPIASYNKTGGALIALFQDAGTGNSWIQVGNSSLLTTFGALDTVTSYFYTSGNLDFYAGAAQRMRLSSQGGVSIGSTYYAQNAGANNVIIEGKLSVGTVASVTNLQVGLNPDTSGSYVVKGGAFIKSLTNNGGQAGLAPMEPALILGRDGIAANTYANFAEFSIGRYINASSNSRTQLDIKLTHAVPELEPPIVMSMRSNGAVGIGVTAPLGILNLKAGTTTLPSLLFTSATATTAPIAGAVEFTTDDLFFTITTGTARKRILFADPVGGLTSTRIPFATTNGRLIDAAGFTYSSNILKVGDGTNYSQFDATGHQTMVGTAQPYEDIRVEPVTRTGVNNPAFEQWYDDSGIGDTGTTRGVYLYTFGNEVVAQEKEIHFTMQMPHAWDGGVIHMHLHWISKTTAVNSKVRWGLEYTMVEPNAVFGATAAIVYADTPISTDTGTTAGKHQITEFADITPTTSQDGLSTIIIGRIFRNSSNAADTYTGDVGLLYIDAHYQLNSLGSDQEYVK